MSRSKLKYITADLFAAPPGSILVHACNSVGSWGAGIAVAFRTKYPSSFEVYKAHCKAHSTDELIGTCLVIRGGEKEGWHDIACLFTSKAYGKRKDPPDDILNATRNSVKDLLRQNTDGKPLHSW